MINDEKMQLITKDTTFPLIEMISAESSNVNGNTVSAYAVTKVIKASEKIRLNALKDLCVDITSKPVIVKGFSFSNTTPWTVPDDIISKYKTFSNDQEFEVIWLQNKVQESNYYGYAGHEIHLLRGIVVFYPEELKNTDR